MNARAEMPDFSLIANMLLTYKHRPRISSDDYWDTKGAASQQYDLLQSWLAAQPLAPEDGDAVWAKVDANGGDERCIPNNAATPPTSAREPVAGPKYYAHRIERSLDDTSADHVALHRDFLRDAAFHLRHPAAGAVVVDDQMVMAACNAYFDALPVRGGTSADPEAMRAALTAAIGDGR